MLTVRPMPRGRFRGDRRGIAALEYGLLASLVGAVLIGSLVQYETAVQSLFRGFDLTLTRIGSNLGQGAAGAGAGTGTGGDQGGGSGGDQGGGSDGGQGG